MATNETTGVTIGQGEGVTWRTLPAYLRAIAEFTRPGGPRLTRASFDRISRSDWSDVPPARTFEVPGGTLGFRHYPAPDSDRALVLVHGSGCFGDTMHELAVRIRRRDGAHVYTLDMRGHGLSPGRRGHARMPPNGMVRDIALFLGNLRASGHSRIVLGGHSAGGGLVLALARSPAGDLADAYLLLAPYLGLGAPPNRPRFGGWVSVDAWTLRIVAAANLLGIRALNGLGVVRFDTGPALDRRYAPGWSYDTLMAFGCGLWDPAAPIPAGKPVLLLSCSGDEAFDPAAYPACMAAIAPQAEVADVGEGGHWDLLVANGTAARTVAWLKGLDADAGATAPTAPTAHAPPAVASAG